MQDMPATESQKQAHAGTPAPARTERPSRDRQGGRGERRPRRAREPRARSEFDNKLIDIRRVTRVVAGGRRFSFSVTVVVGNGHGKVGVGLGKASDTALAIDKATKHAQRNIVVVPLTEGASIPHDIQAKYAAAQVLLIPAPGKGLKAGSAMRTVLELAGVKNVTGKILSRTKNPLNNARATVLALSLLRPARKVAPKKDIAPVSEEDSIEESKEKAPAKRTTRSAKATS